MSWKQNVFVRENISVTELCVCTLDCADSFVGHVVTEEVGHQRLTLGTRAWFQSSPCETRRRPSGNGTWFFSEYFCFSIRWMV